jgi:hypothetical protein
MKTSFSHSPNGFPRALSRDFFAVLSAVAVALLWAHPAFAQALMAQTLGDMACNAQYGSSPYGNVCSVVAYCAGAAFIGQGLHMLVRYYDNPANQRLTEPLTRIFGGTALLAAPGVTGAIVQTIFGYNSGGGLGGCAAGAVTPTTSATVGLDTLLTNLVGNIANPFNLMISTAAILIGFFMVVRGLLKAAKYGSDPREHAPYKILANLIIGCLLMVSGQNFDILLNSLFGTGLGAGATSGTVVTGWNFITELNASTQFITAVQDAGYFFELVGMIAFVRGWMIIKSATEGTGQTTLAQGITHILGGVLAMNIFGFLQIMDNTFGTNFLGPA